MIENPLVSVIIPAYNAEKYVEQAVRSIMTQTYRNLEILVTDDCSTDRTLEILNRLAKEDSRVIVQHNEENKKIVRTLNELVEHAKGKYIARMDADDISLPERIEKQVTELEENTKISFCGTNAWHINEQEKKIGYSYLPLSYEDNKFFLSYYSTFYHPTVMFRSEIYKENLYSSDFLYAEDYELWCRLVFKNNLQGVNLKEKLFKYRMFKKQTSTVYAKEQLDATSKIFNLYNMVDSVDVNLHKNVFFMHKQPELGELSFITNEYEKISDEGNEKFIALQKLLYHLFYCYPIHIFIKFCLKKYGFIVCLKTVINKIRAFI